MRRHVRDLVSIVATALPIREPIYEFGSFQIAGQERLADLRALFPGMEYIGADMRTGPGVDRVLNLHDIDLPAESAGTVLCLDTIEHVEYPRIAVSEIYRILAPHGMAVLTSEMYLRIHNHPSDYWRFTPEGMRTLLKPFPRSFVGYAGDSDFPHTVVGIGFKDESPLLGDFPARFQAWQRKASQVGRLRTAIRLIAPPILLPVLSRMYRGALLRSLRAPRDV